MDVMAVSQRRHVHLTHWGAAEIESDGQQLTSVRPWRDDPDPSRILENLAGAHRHPARIDQPYIRRGWLEHGPGPAARGNDEFVAVPWEQALDLLAGELRRVYGSYGPDGVYGGSYGWASAGRFHHAQSQLHRFLNCLGGYVRSVNNYSFGTSGVLLPHLIGNMGVVMTDATAWPSIALRCLRSLRRSACSSCSKGRRLHGPEARRAAISPRISAISGASSGMMCPSWASCRSP